MAEPSWPGLVTWAEVARSPVRRRLAPGPEARDRIASELGLDGLDELDAEVEAAPWLDGARLSGRFQAQVRQTCGITLEPLTSTLSGSFERKLLPADSPNAPEEPEEAVLDPEAEDPPDLVEGETIDLGAVVVEQLALEVDPFPRKPGVVFDPGPEERPASPFAVLKDLKPKTP